MTEHSRCQPGRPDPHGVSHAGSPGRAPFHSAKSAGSRFAPGSSAFTNASTCCPDNAPYDGKVRTAK